MDSPHFWGVHLQAQNTRYNWKLLEKWTLHNKVQLNTPDVRYAQCLVPCSGRRWMLWSARSSCWKICVTSGSFSTTVVFGTWNRGSSPFLSNSCLGWVFWSLLIVRQNDIITSKEVVLELAHKGTQTFQHQIKHLLVTSAQKETHTKKASNFKMSPAVC